MLLRHPGGGQEPRLKRPGRDADGGGLYPVRPGGGAGAVRPERRHPGRVQPWDGPARAGGVLRGRGGRHGGVRPGQPAAHGELRPGGAAARRRDPAPDGPRGPGGSGGEAGQAGGQGIAEGGEGALRNPGAGPGGHRPGAVFPRHGPVSAPDLPQALYGGGLSARGRLRGLFRVRPGGRAGQDLSVAAGGGRQDPDGAGGAGRQLRSALPQLRPAVRPAGGLGGGLSGRLYHLRLPRPAPDPAVHCGQAAALLWGQPGDGGAGPGPLSAQRLRLPGAGGGRTAGP